MTLSRDFGVTATWHTSPIGDHENRRCVMTVATSTLLGRPLWYELMTSDMKAAEAFYRAVVGWKTAPFDGAGSPYTMFNRSGDVAVASVMTKPDEVKAPPFWAMY